jgi:hydrogenase nickel incorporation protein HypB
MHVIDMNGQIMFKNEEIAKENKAMFDQQGLFVANLMSAPGAGKTSVLERTISVIGDDYKMGVIEGDLETEIDSERIRALNIPSHQIVTGTVCHLDARMVHNALHHFPTDGLEILFIENVGNLVCPAEFYLGEALKVMVFSVVEGAEKPKKYPVMFHEADAVILNKVDLLPYSGVSLDELQDNVRHVNPYARQFPLSCRTGTGVDEWVTWLREVIANPEIISKR